MKLFKILSFNSYEANGWEDLFQQLEKKVVGEARHVYGLENWKSTPGQELTEDQQAILQMERGFFPHMRELVRDMPLNDDVATRVVAVVDSFRDVLASVHRGPTYRAFAETWGRHDVVELLQEERAKKESNGKEDPEKSRLEKAINENKHKNGEPNWTKIGQAVHLTDNGAKKKARKMGLIQ